jgi:hypothetical protein
MIIRVSFVVMIALTLLPYLVSAQENNHNPTLGYFADHTLPYSFTAVYPDKSSVLFHFQYNNAEFIARNFGLGFILADRMHIGAAMGKKGSVDTRSFHVGLNVHSNDPWDGALYFKTIARSFSSKRSYAHQGKPSGVTIELVGQLSYKPRGNLILNVNAGPVLHDFFGVGLTSTISLGVIYRVMHGLYLKGELLRYSTKLYYLADKSFIGAGFMGTFFYIEAGYGTEDFSYDDRAPAGLYMQVYLLL